MMKYILLCAIVGLVYGCEKWDTAFTAKLTKTYTVTYGAAVKYDQVLTNYGKAYQPTTGVFTAPFKGIYSISLTLMSHPDNYVHLQLMKNKDPLSAVFAADKTHAQSGQTLQLVLKKGDKIWVRGINKTPRKMWDQYGYNVFSGVLVQELYDCNNKEKQV